MMEYINGPWGGGEGEGIERNVYIIALRDRILDTLIRSHIRGCVTLKVRDKKPVKRK